MNHSGFLAKFQFRDCPACLEAVPRSSISVTSPFPCLHCGCVLKAKTPLRFWVQLVLFFLWCRFLLSLPSLSAKDWWLLPCLFFSSDAIATMAARLFLPAVRLVRYQEFQTIQKLGLNG